MLAVQALTRGRRIREDAAIAIVLSSFYALGVALLSHVQTMPQAAQAELDLAAEPRSETGQFLAGQKRIAMPTTSARVKGN